MVFVGWRPSVGAGRLRGEKDGGGVMSPSAGTGRGDECPALAWKVAPLELMNRRVGLSAHRPLIGSVLDFNLDELVCNVFFEAREAGFNGGPA